MQLACEMPLIFHVSHTHTCVCVCVRLCVRVSGVASFVFRLTFLLFSSLRLYFVPYRNSFAARLLRCAVIAAFSCSASNDNLVNYTPTCCVRFLASILDDFFQFFCITLCAVCSSARLCWVWQPSVAVVVPLAHFRSGVNVCPFPAGRLAGVRRVRL